VEPELAGTLTSGRAPRRFDVSHPPLEQAATVARLIGEALRKVAAPQSSPGTFLRVRCGRLIVPLPHCPTVELAGTVSSAATASGTKYLWRSPLSSTAAAQSLLMLPSVPQAASAIGAGLGASIARR
jgi:hypothetical protein